MFKLGMAFGLMVGASMMPAHAQDASVEEGLRVSRIGGCHDCHTQGFAESGGQIDPALALKGAGVGYNGPWGTTYPSNLRLVMAPMGEDEFVEYAKNLQTRPPMPWFNLHHMTDGELKSFYRYVKSLGDPGDAAPAYVPPGQAPQTPYIVFAPPQMPG